MELFFTNKFGNRVDLAKDNGLNFPYLYQSMSGTIMENKIILFI